MMYISMCVIFRTLRKRGVGVVGYFMVMNE